MLRSLRYSRVLKLRTIHRTSSVPLSNTKRFGITFKLRTSSSCGLEGTEAQSCYKSVKQILNNIKTNFPNSVRNEIRIVEGTGCHLGLPIKWKLIMGPSGAFSESFTGDKFVSSWGSAGVVVSSINCWEMDPNGICHRLELDDMESCLLTTWIRSGQWLNRKVLNSLNVELIRDAPQSTMASTQAVMSSETSIEETEDSELIKGTQFCTLEAPVDETVDLLVKLATGKVTIKVRISTSTWLPISMSQRVCGDDETWTFQNWKHHEHSNVSYPELIVHKAQSGGKHEYLTTRMGTLPMTNLAQFQAPVVELIPSDSAVDLEKPSSIPAWKTPSCHILVRPLINGEEVGYMILDTGASGLVIEKPTADKLGLHSFGELFVSGMVGKIPASFRKAQSLDLGPLTIKEPKFMEMEMPGLTTGPVGPVIGILGFDIFRRAVVEMQSVDDQPSMTEPVDLKAPNYVVNLYHIERFMEMSSASNLHWMKLHMITSLPHIEARFSINGSEAFQGLFMIDTGAAGASVMFMSKAIDQFGFHDLLRDNSGLFVKGVGGSHTHRLPVKNGTLSWFELGNKKFKDMSCLFFSGSKTDISVYGSGILCMNMLDRCRLIIDYARNRVAVIHEEKNKRSGFKH